MTETIHWVTPAGDVYDLTGNGDGVEILPGVRGRFMPPVRIIQDEIPGQAGSRLREARHGPRDLTFPIIISGAGEAGVRTALRDWLARLNVLAGDGKIRITAPGGDQREITVRYIAGLEGDEDEGVRYPGKQRAAVTVRAFDPYWQDTADTAELFTTGTPATFFPFFPLRLSSSEVFADVVVDNTGDVIAWPVFTFTGPGSAIIGRNLTTGKLFSITDPDVTISAGESVTVDTRPGRKAVTKNDGTNLFPNLTEDSSLWALDVDSNSVRLEMGGASAASSVQIAYRPLYLGA